MGVVLKNVFWNNADKVYSPMMMMLMTLLPTIRQARLKHVSGRKHRYDSWVDPFARFCFTIAAVVSTAQELHDIYKKRDNGLVGLKCLKFIAETPEHLICLAMMADAGSEVIVFIRWLGARNFERALLVTKLNDLLLRLSALFDQK